MLIAFPYRSNPEQALTKKEFEDLTDEACFDLCFSGLQSKKEEQVSETFSISDMPYKLVFKDISGFMEDCKYCGQQRCSGCNVPYSDEASVENIFQNLKLTTNDTLFSEDRKISGKEFQIEVVWH